MLGTHISCTWINYMVSITLKQLIKLLIQWRNEKKWIQWHCFGLWIINSKQLFFFVRKWSGGKRTSKTLKAIKYLDIVSSESLNLYHARSFTGKTFNIFQKWCNFFFNNFILLSIVHSIGVLMSKFTPSAKYSNNCQCFRSSVDGDT